MVFKFGGTAAVRILYLLCLCQKFPIVANFVDVTFRPVGMNLDCFLSILLRIRTLKLYIFLSRLTFCFLYFLLNFESLNHTLVRAIGYALNRMFAIDVNSIISISTQFITAFYYF
jgi:hypothetical protein